jgi:hypothetical protein
MDIQPTNLLERTYTLFVIVSGLILFSSFISAITASMTQLRNMQGESSKQVWLLRRYLRQHTTVPDTLRISVIRHVEHALKQKTSVTEERMWVLQTLSQQLRGELRLYIYFITALNHPVVSHIHTCSARTIHQLTLARTSTAAPAMSSRTLARDDHLFDAGSVPMSFDIVCLGRLKYTRFVVKSSSDSDSPVLRASNVLGQEFQAPGQLKVGGQEEEEESALFGEDSWACEAVLWTTWVHLGSAKAVTEGQMITLDHEVFSATVKRDRILWSQTQSYACKYVKWLNDQDSGALSDIYRMKDIKDTLAPFMPSPLLVQKRENF